MKLDLHYQSRSSDGTRAGSFTEIPETPEELAAAQEAYVALRVHEKA